MRKGTTMRSARNNEAKKERCIYPNLKLHMYTAGIRQNRLAKMVGIDAAYLSRIINGVRVPRKQMQLEIAQALGCDAEWLFERTAAGSTKSTSAANTETGKPLFLED
jgi:transcriptional regulator with XRE-family HTH domain